MVAYESIYPGADLLIPSYNPIGYQVEVGESNLGLTMDGRTANQLVDMGTRVASGAKNIEIQGVDAAVFDAIPKEHFKEMGRRAKLAGVSPSIHGPVVEPSGLNQQGWDEISRLGAEKQMTSVVLRSHELDPKGNVSVTIHSTALPEMEPKVKIKKGKKEEEKLGTIFVIEPKSGKWGAIKPEKRYFPEKGEFRPEGQELTNVSEELKKHNKKEWIESLSGISRYASYGEDMINQITQRKEDMTKEQYNDYLSKIKKGEISKLKLKTEKEKEIARGMQRNLEHGQRYLRDAYQHMKKLFDMAYETATPEDKTNLQRYAQEIAPKITSEMENDPSRLEEFGNIIERGLKVLDAIKTPKMVVPLNQFVINKSSQTISNVAENAYDKFGKTAPIINIENPPAGMGLSKAEDLKKLIVASRKKLAQNLVKNKGLGSSEANAVAEKMIGATWDLGHINMLRKSGYSKEDIIKQSEIIAPYVKHVHLSDNFGYEHTELPMGMGNVPTKEIMARLGEEGFEGKKIIEAVDWYKHFQDKGGQHVLPQTLQSFDSPIYAMKAGPSWGQTQGFAAYAYSAGQGAVPTPVSQSIYGAGWSGLPIEVGGPIGGDQSRMSGTPTQ